MRSNWCIVVFLLLCSIVKEDSGFRETHFVNKDVCVVTGVLYTSYTRIKKHTFFQMFFYFFQIFPKQSWEGTGGALDMVYGAVYCMVTSCNPHTG